MDLSISPHPFPHGVLASFLIFNNTMNEKYYLSVVLICMVFIMRKVEKIIMLPHGVIVKMK